MSHIQMVDGLEQKEVLIVARVLPLPDANMEERPILLTVGVAEEEVVMLEGVLGDLERLWREGWANYARVQVEEIGEVVAEVAADEAEAADTFVYSDDDF